MNVINSNPALSKTTLTINGLNRKRISKLEDMIIETSKSKKQREKYTKKK